ncbi:MAG: endonuclease III [Zetaproteobacteria bacterium]|nr:MAG: endonuclease III [Zetaproteobacteria bacterium]
MPDEDVAEMFRRLAAANPEPKTELNYTTPFELLVAVVLSAQATDKGVNRVTKRLFRVANTPQKILELGEERLSRMINSIGLYRTKARNLVRLSKILVEKHGGQVPKSREALEALPGVGRKTANVILNVLWGKPTIAVDTHIFRVANRTGLAPGKTPLAVERLLTKRIPPAYRRHAHHWLVLFGRYVCTARKPKCLECPIRDLCRWPEKRA